ncbi:MAG: hypothetical protein RIR26_2659, partial [Pseudomonadota bacterium]
MIRRTETRVSCWAVFFTAAAMATACQDKSISEVLQGDNRDFAAGGVVSAERSLNGTVKITFRGNTNADSYEIYEDMKDKETPEAELPTAKTLKERLLTPVEHAAGKLIYEITTSHIPFGGQYCYRLGMLEKGSGNRSDLGATRCLTNEQNWVWTG